MYRPLEKGPQKMSKGDLEDVVRPLEGKVQTIHRDVNAHTDNGRQTKKELRSLCRFP